MSREQLLSNIWVRMIVFAWMVIFPIVFVGLPVLEMFTGESKHSWTPVWGLLVWLLAPWVASILLKHTLMKSGD